VKVVHAETKEGAGLGKQARPFETGCKGAAGAKVLPEGRGEDLSLFERDVGSWSKSFKFIIGLSVIGFLNQ
jgi:hypothetical protein